MRPYSVVVLVPIVLVALAACPGKKEGSLEGLVTPPGPGIRVAALQQGKTVAAADIDPRDGRFKMSLPAGQYDISFSAKGSPFPLMLSAVVVNAGETTILAPVSLAWPSGTAAVAGRVLAAGAGARVTLLAEGVERASFSASADGRYEFTGLPAGRYTLQVAAPGYANDSLAFDVADNQRQERTVRLLYVTPVAGIDWSAGNLRARGIGMPPKQAPTLTVRREMAKRAAIADAERNLLKIIEQVNVAPDQKLTAALGEGSSVQKLQGYLRGYRVAVERDMDGGKIEVELELPLTGPGGLSSLLQP